MIRLTRLDGKDLLVNADQILTVEATPDTVLLLSGGLHLMVKEPPDEVVDRVVAFRRRIAAGPERLATVVALPRPGPED
ncbi:MAG TPA: flagellar FlbD family protein [Anaeromyxobacter sp.]|nr:flagellar FlbD family protein [Anaeromyxobacter sp.]